MKKNIAKLSGIGFWALFMCSCSMLDIGRSFMDEMTATDGLFVAEKDFPVVAGDSGRVGRTNKEIRLRTPTTDQNKAKYDQLNALDDELLALENRQTDQAFQHYNRYKGHLRDNSERIFFLRLSSLRERDEYLYSKGLYSDNGNSPQVEEAIRNRDILLGMSKDAVVGSWGRPARVDVAGNPSYENERWSFYRAGKVRHIYFEGGKVQGWTQ